MPGRAAAKSLAVVDSETGERGVVALDRRWPRPRGFNEWSPGERLEWVFQCSLADLELVLSWDPASLDREHLRIWKDVSIAVQNCGARVGLSARATGGNAAALAEIRAGLAKRDAAAASALDSATQAQDAAEHDSDFSEGPET